MGASAVPVAVMTVFWGFVAFILPIPIYFGSRPNKGVITTVCMLIGVCCWLFWVLCYMHQMNPLIGPTLHNTTLIAIMDIWDGTYNSSEMPTVETTTTLTTSA